MSTRKAAASLLVLCVCATSSLADGRPLLRYVFDRSSTQYDGGTPPFAHGTLTGSPALVSGSPGLYSCNALDLSPYASNHNYVTTGADVQKLDALSAMTITLWVNMRADPAEDDCLLSDMPSGYPPAGTGGWELRITGYGSTPSASTLMLSFEVLKANGGSNSIQSQVSASTDANKRWVFFAVTYSETFVQRYYRGSETGSVAQFGLTGLYSYPLADNTAEFRVGSASSEPTTDRTPPAWVDDVRIYNRVLTIDELEAVRIENLQFLEPQGAPAFFGIGGINGLACSSIRAQALSADGSTVVGQTSATSGPVGFRWRNGVQELLPDFPGGSTYAVAYGVSGDGSVAVGQGQPDGPTLAPCQWDAANTITQLPYPPDATNGGWGFGANGNGSITVGVAFMPDNNARACKWTAGGVESIGYLPGGTGSGAFDISLDGHTIVGVGDSPGGYEGFRWDDGVFTALGDLPGGTYESRAQRIAANRNVIVGYGTSDAGHEAACWAAGRVYGLGDLPGSSYYSEAYGVSANGSYIVGVGRTLSPTGSNMNAAFIWDRYNGMRNLQTVLADDFGLDLTGWTLLFAAGISADGSVIAGMGANPAGMTDSWIARLPQTYAVADFNHDDDVDAGDLTDLTNCLTGPGVLYDPGNLPAGCAQTPDVLDLIPADLDWDGDVDQDDFGAFQRCYSGSDLPPPIDCRG